MSLQKTIKNIQSLSIQGATAVAQATLLELAKFGKKVKARNPKKFVKEIQGAGKSLAYARPTEPLAQNLVAKVVSKLTNAISLGTDAKHLKDTLDYIIKHELKEIEEDKKELIEYGLKIIESGDKILTFCHSSTVEEILISAKKSGSKFKVFVPETRPLFQGRITAKNLSKAKIDVTMIIDSETDELLNSKKVDKVLIGADVILKDGSIINKVGSFGICEDAHQNKIPVYIAALSLKRVRGKVKIKIEKRHKYEVWKKAPKDVDIQNPAFDKVPRKFITGIITEKGILK